MKVTPGAFIYPKIKQKFNNSLLWTEKAETEIRNMCFEIEQPTCAKDHETIVKQLSEIYTYLLQKDIAKSEELDFLKQEIVSYKDNSIISKQVEEHKTLNEAMLSKYVNLYGKDSEGVFCINESLNVEQIREIARESYWNNKKIKFMIPKTHRIRGQIIIEKFGLQSISVGSVYSKNSAADRVVLFDEIPPRGWALKHEVGAEFYSYQFVASNGEKILLLSNKKMAQGRYNVTGIEMNIRDVLIVGEQSKLTSKKKVFLVNEFYPVIAKYRNNEDYRKALVRNEVTKKKFFDYLFLTVEQRPVVLKHPRWFKWLVWSWFLSSPVGRGTKYPFHIAMIAKKNSGKSWLLDGLYDKSLETQNIFSGTGGSIKGLTPSFAFKGAPKLGYLATCHRFAFGDELFKIFRNLRKGDSVEDVAQLNDMLEHKNRVVTTGNGSVEVNFSARLFIAGNPIQGLKMYNMTDLLTKFDPSFVSRLLPYFQNEEHIQMIRESDDETLEQFPYKINNEDFMAFADYLHGFNASWDVQKVRDIYDKYKGGFNPKVADYYDSRLMHHLKCVLDGVIKTRCFFEHDVYFKANDKDYAMLDLILGNLVRSWVSVNDIKFMAKGKRVGYLPEMVRGVYRYLEELCRPFGVNDLGNIPGISKSNAKNALVILLDNELVLDGDSGYYMWNLVSKQLKLGEEE